MFHAPVLNANTGQWEAVSPLDGMPVEDNDRNRLVETLRGLQATRDNRDVVDRLTLDCQQYMDKLNTCREIALEITLHSKDQYSNLRAQDLLNEIEEKK